MDTTGDQQLREYQFDQSQTQISDPLVLPFATQFHSAFPINFRGSSWLENWRCVCRLFTSHGRKDFTVQGLFKPVGIGEVFGGNIAVMDVYSA